MSRVLEIRPRARLRPSSWKGGRLKQTPKWILLAIGEYRPFNLEEYFVYINGRKYIVEKEDILSNRLWRDRSFQTSSSHTRTENPHG